MGIAALVVLAVLCSWLISRVGRWRVKRDLTKQGWHVTFIRWRPQVPPNRPSRFEIEVERESDGRRGSGYAFVGGYFTAGPVWSSRIEYEWDSDVTE